jgi:hypothetical protein
MKRGVTLERPHAGRKQAEADRAVAVTVVDAVDQRRQFRDVKPGQFVTEKVHDRRPTTTERERRPVPSPIPEHKHQPRKGK